MVGAWHATSERRGKSPRNRSAAPSGCRSGAGRTAARRSCRRSATWSRRPRQPSAHRRPATHVKARSASLHHWVELRSFLP